MQTRSGWRETLSICADIIQVTTFFGLSVAVLIAVGVAVIGFFSELSPVLNAVIAVVIGLTALLVLNICTRKSAAGQLDHGVSVDEAELTRAKAELAKQARLRHKQEIFERSLIREGVAVSKMPVPDWPIQELFFHLRPTLRTGNDTAYEATSLEIRDKLSTGQLKIWGWRINLHGERLPQIEIDQAYWQHADFTYDFFFGNKDTPHTRAEPASGLTEYYDLQINQAQALGVWPESKIRRAKAETIEDSPEVPKSIEQHFKEDFPNCTKMFNTLTISAGQDKFAVPWQVCMEDTTGAKFVSFYVAMTKQPFEICRSLVDAASKVLDHQKGSGVQILTKHPGDATHTGIHDLVFSGRVYLYYENVLSLEQLGVLEAAFKARGMTPQFRGQDYATGQWMQKSLMKKSNSN